MDEGLDRIFWRAMKAADLDGAHTLSQTVHVAFPEEKIFLTEKLQLFPQGCFILDAGENVAGYCFSHPWDASPPQKLNAPIGALPAIWSSYFIHDLTLDERYRGQHFASRIVEKLMQLALSLNLPHMTLISVYPANENFWRKQGFTETPDPSFQTVARAGGYGRDALHMERRAIHI